MPCGDYSKDDYINELSSRIKALTQIACELAKVVAIYAERVPVGDRLVAISEETRRWIAKHKVEDRTRLAREKEERERKERKARLLKRLTRDERDLLGV